MSRIDDIQAALEQTPPHTEAYAKLLNELGMAYAEHDTPDDLIFALAAHAAALKIYDPTHYPAEYVTTQIHLGGIYRELAEMHPRPDEHLNKAIVAYQAALPYAEVDYAIVQNNLGNTYWQLSAYDEQRENLMRAIAAYQGALARVQPGPAYAIIYNNLGNVYSELASLEDELANLNKALDAYQETLLHSNPKTSPIPFATMQNNLGHVCRRLADFEDRERNLQRAMTAYRDALKVFRIETSPHAYATLQANMGLIHEAQGDIHEAKRCYKEAGVVARMIGAIDEAEYFFEKERTLAD